MSKTLNVADHLLALGRKHQELGRVHDAVNAFERLANFQELPAEVAEEIQVRLAELALRRRKFLRARRHLTAALTHQPDNSRYHHLMATAADSGAKADPERAAKHFQLSLELDPNQPTCLGEYGMLALKLGRTALGLRCLRRAAELTPDDPQVIGRLAEGLRLANLAREARDVLRAALFRNPRDGRFRKLWNDFQFQQLRREQQNARHASRVEKAADKGPVILPFVRPVPEAMPARKGKIIRRDTASPTPPPHVPRPARLSAKRRAQ